MNKLGGWWRTWIVVTVLWVVVMAAWSFLLIGDTYTVSLETYVVRSTEFSCPDHSWQTNDQLKAIDQELRQAPLNNAEREKVEVCLFARGEQNWAAVRDVNYWHDIKQMAMLVLIPPALLLAIGFVVAWIRRGFRGSASTTTR